MAALTRGAERLLLEPNYAHFATLRRDGTPHLTIVWVDWDGAHVLVNTAAGRAKEHHLRRDPRVAIEVAEPADPYVYVSISGVAELTEEGAEEHIHKLARKYRGEERYSLRPGERRLLVRIRPVQVYEYGLG